MGLFKLSFPCRSARQESRGLEVNAAKQFLGPQIVPRIKAEIRRATFEPVKALLARASWSLDDLLNFGTKVTHGLTRTTARASAYDYMFLPPS